MPKPRISPASRKARVVAKSNKNDINIDSIKDKYSYNVFMVTEKYINSNDSFYSLKRISPAILDVKVAIDILFSNLEQKIQAAFIDVFDGYIDIDDYDSDEDREFIRSLEQWIHSRNGKFKFSNILPDKLKYDHKNWQKINFSEICKNFLETNFPNFRNISDESFRTYFTSINSYCGENVISLEFFELDNDDDDIGKIHLYLEQLPLAFEFNNALFSAAALAFPIFSKKPLHADISKMRESSLLVEFDL